jgi:uncharacterized membrane-anchored protein
MSDTTNPTQRGKVWFVLAVIAQLLILAAVPARNIYTRLTGTTVILKTAPIDPYDVMTGYFVAMDYDISTPPGVNWSWRPTPESAPTSIPTTSPALKDLPDGCPVYATLAKGEGPAWHAVAYDIEWPKTVPADAVVIKGKKEHRRIRFGVEGYYLPETMREAVEDNLRAERGSGLVEVKVDSCGNAAIVKLTIKDKTYEY